MRATAIGAGWADLVSTTGIVDSDTMTEASANSVNEVGASSVTMSWPMVIAAKLTPMYTAMIVPRF